MRRNGLGRARRIDVTPPSPPPAATPWIPARLFQAAAILLVPPRRAAALTLGTSTLLVRALTAAVGDALAEGERQLDVAALSLRAVASLWSD